MLILSTGFGWDNIIVLFTLIGASLSWIITKWLDRRKSFADEKERRYSNLLGTLHHFSSEIETDRPKANKWIEEHKELWLFADDMVLIYISKFLDNYNDDSLSKKYKSKIAFFMRMDLYKLRYTWLERIFKSFGRLFIEKKNILKKHHFRDVSIY